mmetsp:Transcript_17424/g.29531  ORF Transcript_17424/g.29531 Transcript_17424/m.29531 type:complete len:233 (+) Transcript_17424:237-935(+)
MSPKIKLILPAPTCAPALLNANATEKKLYWDRSHYDSPESQLRALAYSSTLYVGNLAFSTRSFHLKRHFEQLGPVKEVQMGLDRFKKTPCGFAFVEFHHRIDALSAVSNLTGTKLDGRVIRVELDAGFKPGRQYGRGAGGGQVRDDRGGGSGRDRKRGRHDNDNVSSSTTAQQPPTWGARWQSPAQSGEGGKGEGGAETSIYGPADTGDGNEQNNNEADESGGRSNKQARIS